MVAYRKTIKKNPSFSKRPLFQEDHSNSIVFTGWDKWTSLTYDVSFFLFLFIGSPFMHSIMVASNDGKEHDGEEVEEEEEAWLQLHRDPSWPVEATHTPFPLFDEALST